MSINLNKVRFMYFGNRGLHRTNVVTVAFTRDDNKIYFGVAYCSKEDIYNKHHGKDVAVSRLITNGTDGLDIEPGVSVYDTIWNYLYNGYTGLRLIYNKPSWVDDVMLVEKIVDTYKFDTTQSLWEAREPRGFFSKLFDFFTFSQH